jgi:hypothetical protein
MSEVGMDERLDARKAAAWSALAGLAHLSLAAVGHLGYPYVRDALIAIAYGLMLPAIAVLHVRHRTVRSSGAILGTIAGTAVVAVGLGGSVNVDLRPAGLFVLGIWWWTIGKMWAETGVLSRGFGLVTAALAAVALVGGLFDAVDTGVGALVSGFPDLDAWATLQVALGAWLVAIAVMLAARSPGDRGGGMAGGLRGA